METTRETIMNGVVIAMATQVNLVAVLNGADRNGKADNVARSGIWLFYEALADERPLPQPTGKLYVASEMVLYFVQQSDGSTADALAKNAQCRAVAFEFLLTLQKQAKSYPLADAIQRPNVGYLYDDTDMLLCGVVLTFNLSYDPKTPFVCAT
jgi:hypothetical protein